jgi:hypothetical protein
MSFFSVQNNQENNSEHMNVSVADKCLELQLDNNIHNRIVPLPSERDKCLLYQPPPSDFVKTVLNFVVGTPNQGKCAGGPGDALDIRPM